MPNHLTRHLSSAAQAFAERLAAVGPMFRVEISDDLLAPIDELVAAGVATVSYTTPWHVALTLAGAEAYRPAPEATKPATPENLLALPMPEMALPDVHTRARRNMAEDARMDAEALERRAGRIVQEVREMARDCMKPVYLAALGAEMNEATLRDAQTNLRAAADHLDTILAAARGAATRSSTPTATEALR
jgi:hypothetical protein